MNISQFTLWDFTVNVVPGTLLLLLFVSLTPQTIFGQIVSISLGSGVFMAFILLVVSYSVGRIFQEGVSREIEIYILRFMNRENQSAINYFKQAMDKARNDKDPTTRNLFYQEAQTFFSEGNVDSIEEVDRRLDDFDLYDLCQEYVIGNRIGRTNRFMILSRFHRSIYVMAAIGIISHLVVQLLWPIFGFNSILSWTQVIVFILTIGIVGAVSYKERWYFEHKVVESLINGFYADRVE